MNKEELRQNLRKLFAAFDADGDGHLDRLEVCRMIQLMKQRQTKQSYFVPEAQIDSFFRKFDTNRDGKIQLDELLSVLDM